MCRPQLQRIQMTCLIVTVIRGSSENVLPQKGSLKPKTLRTPDIRLYSGPLVHEAAARLMRGATPESFLNGGPIPLQLFRDLERAVLDSLDDDIRDRLQKEPQQHYPTRRAQTRGNLVEFARQFYHEDEDDKDYGERRGRRSLRMRKPVSKSLPDTRRAGLSELAALVLN
ncbi:hypothetical protein AALO_G00177480 [Alosa alosa]|uniref:Uncharacterized protein n=1 Tax=Alosa alosa TaxID=278164 RepID=A0AAV6GEP9_9TELE|nr:hypothetical protein AALO_G00177480 [Alosa alosa]